MSDLAALGLGLGTILFALVIVVAMYVLSSLAHMKALKALGYDKAWLAWIPYGVYYGCAESVSNGETSVSLFGKFNVPVMVFRLWWIVSLVLAFVNLNATLENIISIVLNVVFLGCTYAKMYARLENKQESETQVLGCVSGFFPIIAVVKFLMVK